MAFDAGCGVRLVQCTRLRTLVIIAAVTAAAIEDDAFQWHKDAWACSSTTPGRGDGCLGETGSAPGGIKKKAPPPAPGAKKKAPPAPRAMQSLHQSPEVGSPSKAAAATVVIANQDHAGTSLGEQEEEGLGARRRRRRRTPPPAPGGIKKKAQAAGSLAQTKLRKTAPCIPHDGFAPINGSWLEPYATSTLPTDLEGCNPASCFNAVRCGIPNCTSVPWGSVPYFKAQHHRGGTDPGINTSPALPYSPKTNLANIWIHPMTRLTATKPLNYNADAFKCYPASNGDSYLYPDAGAGSKYCNPDKLSVCNKHIIAHSCLEGHSTVEAKHLAIVIQKYVLCFKQGEANKCFSSKTSRCVRFDVGLMPTYCSSHSRTKAILADKELRAGRWTECSGDVAALVEEYATMVQ